MREHDDVHRTEANESRHENDMAEHDLEDNMHEGHADHMWAEHHHHHGPPGGRRGRRRFGFPGGPDFGDDPDDDIGGSPVSGGPVRFGVPVGPPGVFYGRHGWVGGPGFGPRGRGRRGSRARRGDVRAAALALLAEEPMNGYQIIQQIGERSGGLWRASPGSVYPALAQLEDENLISPAAGERGRRAYALTDQGHAYVAEHAEQLRAPWSDMTSGAAGAAADMRSLVRQVHLAAFQVVSAGTDAQLTEARKILAQARRSLYRILAEDEAGSDSDGD